MLSEGIREHARRLWDYHVIGAEPADSVDFALALGCSDVRVAGRAAEVVIDGRARFLVASGGYGKISGERWREPEAARFARVAGELGVPDDQIIIEDKASNSGQNIEHTRDLLDDHGVRPSSGLLVCKPYMERRSLATAVKQWPEIEWSVTSPQLSFQQYPTADVPFRQMVELMVGDLQRIALYAERGYQVPQEIPQQVWRSYEALVSAGYDRHLVPVPPNGERAGR